MPLEFECPHCRVRTLVDDRFSGQSGPCANCGQTITIPAISGAVGSAPPSGAGGGAMVLVFVAIAVLLLVLCAGGGMLAIFGFGRMAIAPPPIAVAQSPCRNNLQQIALAMHNYHDTYSTFPPAYLADENGTPMHSWRVLLLPFLNEQSLYDAYNFDEPWDSDDNLRIAQQMPAVYWCLDDPIGGADETSYAMIAGPGFLADGEHASRLANITDGTSRTLMVVESHGSGIVWTEPRDLDGTMISFGINNGMAGELNGHPEGVQAAFCDGSVRTLHTLMTAEDVEALATIAGGESVVPP